MLYFNILESQTRNIPWTMDFTTINIMRGFGSAFYTVAAILESRDIQYWHRCQLYRPKLPPQANFSDPQDTSDYPRMSITTKVWNSTALYCSRYHQKKENRSNKLDAEQVGKDCCAGGRDLAARAGSTTTQSAARELAARSSWRHVAARSDELVPRAPRCRGWQSLKSDQGEDNVARHPK